MKRYFNLPTSKLVCELVIKEGCNPSIDEIKKYLKTDDIVEVSRKEYNRLVKEYSR